MYTIQDKNWQQKFPRRLVQFGYKKNGISGPPRPIFGRQGLYSGDYIKGVPPLLAALLSIHQNLGKALVALPAMAPLLLRKVKQPLKKGSRRKTQLIIQLLNQIHFFRQIINDVGFQGMHALLTI